MSKARIVLKWMAYFVVPAVVGLLVASRTKERPFGTVVNGVLPVGLLWPLGGILVAWYDIRRRQPPPA